MTNTKGLALAKHGDEIARECFLLLEPESLCDSGKVAQKLSRCRGVKEVHVTSGRYGFVVAAKTGEALKEVTTEVRRLRTIKSAYVAVSHLVYKNNEEKMVKK